MTCYHPIKAFIIQPFDKLEPEYIFAPMEREYVIYHHKKITDYILLPCRKCDGCLVDRSKEWATRMMLEMKYHKETSFITLTYNDDYVPKSEYFNEETGEMCTSMTLRKKEFQNFMKRLRRQLAPVRIRFFACGEYGEKHKRPHYHAIIFGYGFDDKKPYKERDGFIDYRSPLLESVWTDPDTLESKGFCIVNQANWNTFAYVSRYCLKKYGREHNIYYQSLNIEPEFNLMSRRPGIGRLYYEDHKDELYIKQKIVLPTIHGIQDLQLPEYYDRLYTVDNPDKMEEVKYERTLKNTLALETELRKRDLTHSELLRIKEKDFKERIKKLRREYY